MTNSKTNTNNYPFATKASIKERIAIDTEFVLECVTIMESRQTEDEKESNETKHKNKRGWMSSHAVNGGKIAAAIRSGEDLSDEDTEKARGMVSKYSKQLASHFRMEKMANDPGLEEAGAVFGL